MPKPARSRNLLDFLFDVPKEEFLNDYYPHRALIYHGPPERFGGLEKDPTFQNPEATLHAAKGDYILGFHHKRGSSVQAQSMFARFSALGMLQEGWSLNVDFLDQTVPALGKWMDSLQKDLGLKPGNIFCSGIISPAGSGVPKHFDSVEVFTIQLYGSKKWWWAPATEIAFPGTSVMPGVKNNYRDGNMRPDYYPKDISKEMPKGAKSAVMKPGSAMFMPRGWWHQTYAETLSISLNVGIRMSTGVDALTGALQSELEKLDAWRKPLPLATPEHLASARQHLAALLKDLAANLENFDDKAVHWASKDGPSRPRMGPPK
ncbi:JmjC domain-containing protein [Archangium sp.]|jgi:50S ribosomal protein L16 3-hydroxylase|uniref:JmjC domain-containing protein n=1 Tax=Archangium sp. TaxID=1872627 RepID=UPI002ED7EF8C